MKFVIVGTGRCGTTFLRDLLNRHPDCFVCRESYWHVPLLQKYGDSIITLQEFADGLFGTTFPDGRSIAEFNLELIGSDRKILLDFLQSVGGTEAGLRRWLAAVEAFFLDATGKTVFGDKTPHYGYHLRALRVLWPDLKVIHIHRDGRDTAVSMSRHPGFQLSAQVGVDDWSVLAPVGHILKPVKPIGEDPRAYLELWARQIERIAENLAGLPSEATLEVRYSDLLNQPQSEMQRVARFLDLPADASWLAGCAKEVERPATVADPAQFEGCSTRSMAMLQAFSYVVLKIVAPGDWSTVGPMHPVVVRAPPDKHLRAVFMTKAVWAADPLSVEGIAVEFDTHPRNVGDVYLIHPPEAMPRGEMVVRVEDRTGVLRPAFIGLVCSSEPANDAVGARDRWTTQASAPIVFLTHDADSPDTIPGSLQVAVAEVSESELLNGHSLDILQRHEVRAIERHSLSAAQVESEYFWGEEGIEIDHMRSKTSWVTPPTYMLGSADSLANLTAGFVMPRPGAIWSDSLTTPWRDYLEPVRQSGCVLSVDGQIFFSAHTGSGIERFRGTAFHFCPPYHYTHGHWLTEALPALWLLRDPIRAGLVTPISPPLSAWQIDSIRALGIDPACVRFFDSEYVQCDHLISHSLCRLTTSWGGEPQDDPFRPRPTIGHLPTWGWGNVVRDTLRDLQERRHGRGANKRAPEKIFVDRLGVNHPRTLSNAPELATRLALEGFAVVHPEALNLDEEIDLFSNARIVVGQQGSGLMNVCFSPPGCHVVEILPDHYVYDHYRWWAALCGHTYARFVVAGNPAHMHPWSASSFSAPIDAIQSHLATLHRG